MKKIIYAKCSVERKSEYQISTVIENDDNVLTVKKRAVNTKAIPHIKNMYNTFKEYDSLNKSDVRLVPCKLESEDTVSFEYINGETFESIISRHIENEDFDNIDKAVELLKNIIFDFSDTEIFEFTPEFIEVFGKYEILKGMKAAKKVNIDMATNNILINNFVNIIDYEWVFGFAIPLKFILYRSLFLSVAVSCASETIRRHIIEYCEISEDEEKVFFEMEKSFQSYISGNTIGELYEKIPHKNYNVYEEDLALLISEATILDKDGNIVFEKSYSNNTFEVELDCQKLKSSSVSISPMQVNGIVKLLCCKALDKNGSEIDIVPESNARFSQYGDYYFDKIPIFKLELKDYKKIIFSTQQIIRNNCLLTSYIDSLEESYSRKIKILQLEEQVRKATETFPRTKRLLRKVKRVLKK